MKIGFIGLGVMGRAMVANLLRAGHEVTVWARRAESMQPLQALGARTAASPADCARGMEAVCTIVTTGDDVRQVVLGPQGVIEGAQPGCVLIDHSTIPPSVARDIAAALAARDIDMLDAPVSGGERGAIDATLSIMAGGDAAVFERMKPLLSAVGRTLVHVGPTGAGQVTKACNQLILCAFIEAAAEAARLAAASGVDFGKVREAMLHGSAGSKALELFGGKMAGRDFSAGVQSRLHHKDMGIVLGEAVQLGLAMPLSASVWQQLNALMAHGGGTLDTSALLTVLERQSSPR
ncbi:Putative 2-hydroxy-3-oxopropionate reductase, garR [Methyloversatilis universalis FAM5]|jgi:2-hydroxy-3-oxopropionate reductase|uniref:2-hydroxy-3-oxopropionate reductase, garR n=1 Tax=Methyloversatilis universalis (strain ATCC BAA-1314 / DSM 25237 / JCM 13912 / CCUG 52030 / FAM5) TaxID=1000565 RepID=F5R9G8_METUF|nr:NAD(P)-dependent oxidoreductase [Methyloversatilis universalis]EGK73038.1 Putative 2-hydroxy-3-oxopropionate reductase, garR [Methyloversatilis universalis FAM5]